VPRPHLLLTPEDVGRRVVVRRILGEEGGRTVYGDVVGALESWSEGHLSIRRRDGSLVEVSEGSVVAGKIVPAEPPKRRGRPTQES
jgi:N-acetylglutamate synthase